MARDSIDQLQAIRDFSREHKEDPACAKLSDFLRRKISQLLLMVSHTVAISCEKSGLDRAAVLRETVNYQRVVGSSKPTIKIGEQGSPAEQVIRETNILVAKQCEAILQESWSAYEEIIENALALVTQDTDSDSLVVGPKSMQISA